MTVFDSNAILLYLAEKTGKFLPPSTPAARGPMLSWLMFIASGIGPFSGQAVHFRHNAPEPVPYAANRYLYEANRHWGIVDTRLAKHRYMLGDDVHARRHGVLGLGAPGAVRARRRRVAEVPERQAAARRDQRAAGRAARARAQGPAHVQDRDGRRGARANFMFPQNVSDAPEALARLRECVPNAAPSRAGSARPHRSRRSRRRPSATRLPGRDRALELHAVREAERQAAARAASRPPASACRTPCSRLRRRASRPRAGRASPSRRRRRASARATPVGSRRNPTDATLMPSSRPIR